MATEHIPQIDNLIKDFGERLREDVKKASKEIEQEIKELKKYQESEGKPMLHNVTIKHEENKALEQYWVMRAIKEFQHAVGSLEISLGKTEKVFDERKLDHEPTPQEIAQFLSDSKSDFVSVVQNYRFENELPF